MSRIRIIIADDHPVVRDGLCGMLESQPDFEVVGEAADGEATLRLANELLPDLILMDLRMPVVDGASATRQIKSRQPGGRILVLTTYDSDADILPAIEAGATGYLLKDTSREELYHAIRAAASGEPFFAPSVARRLIRRIRSPDEEKLSSRELEVLGLVAGGASNNDIASRLHISQATVKSHLIHIFGKLGVSDRTAAVTVALQRGLI
ncbi:MAG TPA: response regulator transcription factor, partial [Anaerolineales bacterium]|nr:response regulator transcription factor [Anaerolineales bacterium]